MNIWEILGIEQTTDLVVIKQAYAKKAKQYHPEEHPEEFQRLQNAFRMAEKYAKQQKVEELNESYDWQSESEEQFEQSWQQSEVEEQFEQPEDCWEEAFDYEAVEKINASEGLFCEIAFIMKSSRLRNSVQCWKILFGRDEYADVLKEDVFTQRFLKLVENQYGWKNGVLQYFEELLRENDRKGAYDQYHIRVRKKRSSRYDRIEEKYIHKQVCAKAKKKIWNLWSKRQLELYLQYYISCMDCYGKGHEEKRKRLDKFIEDVKFFILMLVAFFIVYGSVSYFSYKVEPKKYIVLETPNEMLDEGKTCQIFFVYKGEVCMKATVEKGTKIPRQLIPTDIVPVKGYWRYNDNKPFKKDTIIEWQEE